MDSMCVYTLTHINGALNFPVLYQSATEAMVDNNCYVYMCIGLGLYVYMYEQSM